MYILKNPSGTNCVNFISECSSQNLLKDPYKVSLLEKKMIKLMIVLPKIIQTSIIRFKKLYYKDTENTIMNSFPYQGK